MSGMEWMVVLGGVAAIAWVNWWFFLAQRGAPVAVAAVGAAGAPEVVIEVLGGYTPAAVQVKAGQPVRLVFDRKDTSSCSEEIVLADFGIRRWLPTGKRTVVEVTPPAPGRYEFTCGMGMLHGALIAEA